MRVRNLATSLIACLWAGLAVADDQIGGVGVLDLRWVHDSGGLSYLNGGYGALRFDPDHEDIRLGRAFVAAHWRLGDLVTLHAVVDAYGDHDRNPVDLSEFWVDVRPFPTSAVRWSAKIGAFHMPVSLENRASGWSDVYSITPSALNSWLGEEFRTIGAEVQARWLGASSGYLGDLALVAAIYGWNDPAGQLLADGGFSLTDRPSTLFGGIGQPPFTFYHEVDRRPGDYTGLIWRHHDWLEVRALHYDNRADPGAMTASEFYAWRTRFSSVGARVEPSPHWTLIAQYLDGDTAVGPDFAGDDQFRMNYHAAFALASFECRRERFTARFDEFGTHQLSGYSYGPPDDDWGHAWTVAWMHELAGPWQLAAEWIRVSSRFPPRTAAGIPDALLESQLQLAVRYRLHFGI